MAVIYVILVCVINQVSSRSHSIVIYQSVLLVVVHPPDHLPEHVSFRAELRARTQTSSSLHKIIVLVQTSWNPKGHRRRFGVTQESCRDLAQLGAARVTTCGET